MKLVFQVKREFYLFYYNAIITTIIIEYTRMFLNQQDAEYSSGPKIAKILNMEKFWI